MAVEQAAPRVIQVKVLRSRTEKDAAAGDRAVYDTFRVPLSPGMSISNVLQHINRNFDGGVAHYLSCRRGVCSGCMVTANGKTVLACMELVDGDLVLEPVRGRPLIKDMVVDI